MSTFPKKCLVDTNVPKTANRHINPVDIPDELVCCVSACIDAVNHVLKSECLVIDSGDEIFTEYLKNLEMCGQPGIGDKFMKWVHDNRWNLPKEDQVAITKNSESYEEFPQHDGLKDFDKSDRKFIAVANAHPNKPPILQGTDSKWWGWKDALTQVGITVQFLCPDYSETKYKKKIGT